MASESTPDLPGNEREQGIGLRSATQPSKQSGPTPFNDGQELLRDTHC